MVMRKNQPVVLRSNFWGESVRKNRPLVPRSNVTGSWARGGGGGGGGGGGQRQWHVATSTGAESCCHPLPPFPTSLSRHHPLPPSIPNPPPQAFCPLDSLTSPAVTPLPAAFNLHPLPPLLPPMPLPSPSLSSLTVHTPGGTNGHTWPLSGNSPPPPASLTPSRAVTQGHEEPISSGHDREGEAVLGGTLARRARAGHLFGPVPLQWPFRGCTKGAHLAQCSYLGTWPY